jgi:hypothetical protein
MNALEMYEEDADGAAAARRGGHPAAQAARVRSGPSAGLVALVALQAWVWTASALPKLTSRTFLIGFARFVATPAPTRPALYGRLVTHLVLVAPSLFAWGALLTESALALTFTVATVVMLGRRGSLPRPLTLMTAAASLVGAGFALNLALLVGDPAPWTLGDPFDSGVALEYLLVGLSLATAVSTIATIRRSAWRARGDRPADAGTRLRGECGVAAVGPPTTAMRTVPDPR